LDYHRARVSALAMQAREIPLALESLARASSLVEHRQSGDFMLLCRAYREAALEVAHARSQLAEPAARYDDMESFWSDAAAQRTGGSDRTIWDVYENGRRRQLEQMLAAAAGSSGALLLNSGMTAIDIAIRSLELAPGDTLLTARRGYFETTEYLEQIVSPMGVRVVRQEIHTAVQLEAAIATEQPRAVLIEAFLNAPETLPAPDLTTVLDRGIRIIMDNSVLGLGIDWFASRWPDQVLVIESGLKYLCHRCSSGVIYGGSILESARRVARQTGAQLQSAALTHVMDFELQRAADRVLLHGLQRRKFRAAMQTGPWAWIRDCDDAASAADPVVKSKLLSSGGGALLFARLDVRGECLMEAHRMLISHWHRAARAEGLAVAVQAGFGWDWISIRAYEAGPLNQKDGDLFVRVSVGTGPDTEVVRSAQLLNQAAETVLHRLN
jgi:hypothetical protein